MAALRAVEPFAGYVYSMAEAASGRGWGPLSPQRPQSPQGCALFGSLSLLCSSRLPFLYDCARLIVEDRDVS
jgi:hypothetical protein